MGPWRSFDADFGISVAVSKDGKKVRSARGVAANLEEQRRELENLVFQLQTTSEDLARLVNTVQHRRVHNYRGKPPSAAVWPCAGPAHRQAGPP